MKNEVVHGLVSVSLGCLTMILGGFDSLLIALIVLMLCDWVIGGLKACKQHKYSPSVFLWGFLNKIVALIIVIAMNFIQNAIQLNLPVRETVITLLLINETLSLLKNASVFVKGLEPITKYFDNIKINLLKIFTVGGDGN